MYICTSPWATDPPLPKWHGPPHHLHLGDDAGNAGGAVQYRVSPAPSVPDSPFHPVNQHPTTLQPLLNPNPKPKSTQTPNPQTNPEPTLNQPTKPKPTPNHPTTPPPHHPATPPHHPTPPPHHHPPPGKGVWGGGVCCSFVQFHSQHKPPGTIHPPYWHLRNRSRDQINDLSYSLLGEAPPAVPRSGFSAEIQGKMSSDGEGFMEVWPNHQAIRRKHSIYL